MWLMIHPAHDKPARPLKNVDKVHIALAGHQVYGLYQCVDSSHHPTALITHPYVCLIDTFGLLAPLLCSTFLMRRSNRAYYDLIHF